MLPRDRTLGDAIATAAFDDEQTDFVHLQRRRGRGAITNRSGRFEGFTRVNLDDGWGALDDESPPLKTHTMIDSTRTIIARNQSPDIPFDQSINPYRGCEHGCVYCFARPTHAYLGLSPGLDFETQILIKPNAAELLRQELAKKSYRPSPIAMGTNTDPYQPLERELKITRSIVETLLECRHPMTLVTKNHLVTRDIDLYAALAQHQLIKVFVSITTLDRQLARKMEPRASTPAKRLAALQALSEAGVPTGVMVAPLIPGLNDHELEAIVEAAASAGAMEAERILLRLPLEITDLFQEWLIEHEPHRGLKIINQIKNLRDGKLNHAEFHQRFIGSGPYADIIRQRFEVVCRKFKLNQLDFDLRCDLFQRPQIDGQLSLI